jgi:hypothetical protein
MVEDGLIEVVIEGVAFTTIIVTLVELVVVPLAAFTFTV